MMVGGVKIVLELEVGVGHSCKEAFPVLVFCCILAVAEGGFEWESWVWITRLD